MSRISQDEIMATYTHIFPSVKLPSAMEKIGKVALKSKDLIQGEEQRFREFLEYAFSLFRDPFGKNLEHGIYVVDEEPSLVEDAWLLLRFAAYVPTSGDEEVRLSRPSSDLADWFEFYTPQHQGEEKKLELFSVTKNGVALWGLLWPTEFFPLIQRDHQADQCLLVSAEGLDLSKRLANLFPQDSEYDIETIKLAERLRKAIYWYNRGFEQNFSEYQLAKSSFWNLESRILFMAIAFETLFQPPKADIQKHLETSLKVLFPDNEFVPKWLNQFYAARSAIAHGSSLETKELEFKPDKSGHYGLIYWSRRIFRACVEATVLQWETARKSGLLKLMTPNRIRLNRILGRLKSIPEKGLIEKIPEDIQVDIRDLHASWMDTPDESYLEQAHNIGRILCLIATQSPDLANPELRIQCGNVVSLPHDWFKVMEHRLEALDIYTAILELFGDEGNIVHPLVQLDTQNELERVLYHWFKFAYAHIWSIDVLLGLSLERAA